MFYFHIYFFSRSDSLNDYVGLRTIPLLNNYSSQW